ncbi:MAG: hypothetical protein A3J24_06875 [Deltaproteobacteria bacterium RIFCSPLOWO2_02_FULL_53_8]|nr:MAG: hypothetical protein A3J24_06875 [Deltaproteobacteria bacterium RIFCSPLOWO2_02_FULL_53_8]
MSASSEKSRIIKQWIEYAEEDLHLARHGLKIKSSCPYKLIAFHAQQCAEKYLKAFLVLKKVDFPYTHNIALLLELCSTHAEWAKEMQGAAALTQYAVTARYPGKGMVDRKEAVQAVETAIYVRKTLKKALEQGMS